MRNHLLLSVTLCLFFSSLAVVGQVAAAEDALLLTRVQAFGKSSGIAVARGVLYRSDDDGRTWRDSTPPLAAGETLAAAAFADELRGFAVASNTDVFATVDGGASWTRVKALAPADAAEAHASGAEFEFSGAVARLTMPLVSGSNFERAVVYESADGGANWTLAERRDSIRRDDGDQKRAAIALPAGESLVATSAAGGRAWHLTMSGECLGFKTECVQETKIRRADLSLATPPDVAESARLARGRARLAADRSVFALPPNGNTRISLQRGFDKCTAATTTQMQTWWNNSPFYDVNIYFSGRNRGCSQAQLSAAWVNTVTAQGWGLIPTVVGYQSPCTASTTSAKFSTDPATAETQGRGEADIAAADAANIGLTAGSILYYDMERYDDVSGTGACSTPTKAFLKGWTDRIKELGFKSGVYGSPFNANGDWINMAAASQPDVVWLARWNNVMSVWGVAPLPDTFWTNHQRIHQWLGPRDEVWGGVTFNIDNNISDAPVASAAIAKNKRADFDGDGKTDVSVWRPDTGVWYVANSGAPGTYAILTFGLPTDIMTPGDFDADGKTDFAVWRPDNGVWHLFSRSIYRSFAFGAPGDIPAAADYDGDGRTDAAVYRPSTGVWYIMNSFDSRNSSYTIQQFGLNGDIAVPGDYDNDGKADIAVYRPSTGVWYLLRSTLGFSATAFGGGADVPVPADYDGDGRTDIAVFRDGSWSIQQSTAGLLVTGFGIAGDVPSAGDYDGDGKYDIAVFRPSSGVWYVQQSAGGYLIQQFGIATDRPVPRAYTPQ